MRLSEWRVVTLERIRISERFTRPMEIWRAQWYASLGEKDKALESLEESFKHRNLAMMFISAESHFDFLRDDPRFEDLIRRVEGK